MESGKINIQYADKKGITNKNKATEFINKAHSRIIL